jgi:hypothetical protein
MAHPEGLSQWTALVTRELPVLSTPHARVLALWSYGIALTRSCACPTVACFLALVLGKKYEALRQCLGEWCYDAADQQGLNRRDVEVTTCFAPLLAWVLRLWTGKQVALALDATSLGDQFTVLAISVVFRGNAIPVAWKVLPAQEKHAWRRQWLVLLRRLRPAIPPDYQVIVLADRGLYARWLFRRIVRLGWHPFLRINTAAKFRPLGQDHWYRLRALLPSAGQTWCGRGTAFVSAECRLPCTLLACWEHGYTDPWFILTDLAPQAADPHWYLVRGWIEQGFKCTKRGGWQWQQTRMTHPSRVERLWLALAVATLWVISVGAALEQAADLPALQDLAPSPVAPPRPRRLRLFRLGLLHLLACLVTTRPLPLPHRLVPDPWPDPARDPPASSPHSTTAPAA